MKTVGEMRVGPEATLGDVCSMLDQLHELQSVMTDDIPPSDSLVERVNTAVSKLPSNSALHSAWQVTWSHYQQVIALINLRRSDLTEARTRLAPVVKDCGVRVTESMSCHSSSRRLAVGRPQSHAGNYSPPVCHVKPTPVVNETTDNSSTAPFDLRTYLIDKNAPVTEPVFRRQLTCLVQNDALNSSEMTERPSSDDSASVASPCVRPVSDVVQSTSGSAFTPMQSRWKTLKKKAVGLLTDGRGSGRSSSQSERSTPSRPAPRSAGIDGFPRSKYTCY